MKLITFEAADGAAAGVLSGDAIYPFPNAARLIDVIGRGNDAVLALGQDALATSEPIAAETVRVLAPVDPPQVRDSMCFHEHIRNAGGDLHESHSLFPTFYFSNAAGVIGPQDDVRITPGCERFDYELEVAAVIGVPASNVSPQDAAAHIAGYTIYIDWSARDLQQNEMALRLGPAKGKDGATTLGPVLVTPDEFAPYAAGKGFDAAMTVEINGEPFSTGNWSSIDWSFDDVVAYTSRGTTLRTGDVLGSGTVGRGCLLEHSRTDPDGFRGWLRPGDVVTFEVEHIGRFAQRVVEPLERFPLSSGY
ncbi:fumarylacetoacetate hydrolase family protein [Cumulibacter manganitolerans]|uniref:fumarylacetoacetate hydrolase family protein n=1 Tax=Cumulibacter manganitolerans TaxID=1884992 RepID=UPI0012980522|nr:fumarylacetoacetate hydrolase family protein [Cumulibacter manganitolerans]